MQLARRNYGYPDILALPLRCAPVWTAVLLALTVVSGIAPTLEVMFIAAFLDAAGAALSGAAPVDSVLVPIALVAVAVGWNMLSWHILALTKARITTSARAALRPALLEKRARLAYQSIEDPEAWDMIQRVGDQPEKQMVDALDSLTQLILLAMRVVGIMALLVVNVWWAALAILALVVPMTALALKSGKASYQADKDNTKIKRKCDYLSQVLTGRDAAHERAMFGYGDDLNETYKDEFLGAYRHAFRIKGKWFMRRGVSGLIFALMSIGIVAILLPAALSGALSFGLFMSLSGSMSGLANQIGWTLGWCVDGLAKRREALRDLGAFLALGEEPGALDAPDKPLAFEKLELRDVRFAYPGAGREILSGLTMTIERGRHYAFVGVNGAGKTTITKLLTGLYGGYEGEILLNGKDLRSYSQAQLKACFSLVYQDFSKYNISVKDNIAFSMPEREKCAADALATVGLSAAVDALPGKIDTPLGKVEGEGQDLSGGEWQRLAMARAVVNPAPVRILDEPTAALDPISESRVYEEFETVSRGKTTVFISHRLGSTALADTIYVLGEGRVLEQGSHKDLMKLDGIYAQMYASQRSWYE